MVAYNDHWRAEGLGCLEAIEVLEARPQLQRVVTVRGAVAESVALLSARRNLEVQVAQQLQLGDRAQCIQRCDEVLAEVEQPQARRQIRSEARWVSAWGTYHVAIEAQLGEVGEWQQRHTAQGIVRQRQLAQLAARIQAAHLTHLVVGGHQAGRQ